MYSFLFYAAVDGPRARRAAEKAREITRRLMPSLGCSLEVSERTLPQVNGGWFYFYPRELADNPLITESVNDELAVLAFGDMVRPSSQGTAAAIAAAWPTGGIEAVRRLDACFGAVIADLVEHTIYIASDLMGLRTLTYFHEGDVLLVSPHDVPIVATGLCPIDYDLVSAASVLACDWSLGGKALLKHLAATDPNEYTVWKDGSLRKVHKPVIQNDQRLDAADKQGIGRIVDEMIDKMRQNARCLSGDAPQIEAELTAGLDSRMVMALLLSILEPARIQAITGGTPTHYDVKTAMRMASEYGFNHRHFAPGKKVGESFLPFSRLLAFVTNGTTNSKRATFRLPQPATSLPPTFVGNGGELYRGFYGPSPLRRPALSRYTPQQVVDCLDRAFPRMRSLEWADPRMTTQLGSRLRDSIETLATISGHPSDLLNLFYLYERYCRWGSGTARRTYVRNRYSLFQSPALLQLAWRLPAPISQNSLLHRTVLKRYAPRSYHWLINRNKYLPLLKYPKVSKVFSEVMIRLTNRTDRLRKCLPGRSRTTTYHEEIGDVFTAQLADTLRDMLLADNSIALEILGKDATRNMLDQHIAGAANHIQTIGFLVTLQQYRNLITEASTLARQTT